MIPAGRDSVPPPGPLAAYKLRLRRRRLLARSLLAGRRLRAVVDRTDAIGPGAILAFACIRDEALRLPRWLDHHRGLGVDHFLIVDNDGSDGGAGWLARQPDVSLWTTAASYKAARFGMDWLGALMLRHGHGHWCLTVDADELFVYAHHDVRPLGALTGWLEDHGARAMGALMLDLYPEGRLSETRHAPGDDPAATLPWFDAGNYVALRQPRLGNLWVQGGPRARAFFASEPRRAPTLSKVPLVRWDRRFVYVSSTHSLLPRGLNMALDPDPAVPRGVLLHSKFLPNIADKSVEEKTRRQHFENSDLYQGYYDALIGDPVLWTPRSSRLDGWAGLETLGLLSRGGWD